eukprot:TRINITY_DN5801_c0_g2_i1.p1 TRINITY_DN5801_c0_g2~~TRINITY_DN5801_c0_g2_i1.p1  ORF type:complete len:540 (+),score=224.37 TRINITY_DN5801_c0_g2_i1:86-1705(+)
MMKQMRRSVPSLLKEGHKQYSGVDQVILRNAEACKKLSKVTRTSFGPNGMNKMVINHLEKLFVTSDAATILREMEIVHPAAKMIVLAAQQQEREIGDGSNLVVVLAGELLNQAEALIRGGVHASEIISGYNLAYRKALEIIPELTCYEEKELTSPEKLAAAIRSAVSAKQYGYEDILCPLIAEACALTMPRNHYNFLVDNVRVCKILGQSVGDSFVVKGMVVDRDTEGSVKRAENVKVALFNCALDAQGTETKGTVLINSAEELLNYNASEEQLMEKHVQEIKEAGAGAVIIGGTISQLALHFLEKYHLLAIKVSSKHELRRLARCTGARMIPQLGAISPEDLGFCSSINVQEVGSHKITILNQNLQDSALTTIVIRGSSQNILNDIERAVDDGVNVVRSLGRDARFVPGAAATEIELARRLQSFAEQNPGLEQYAIRKFGEALEVVARTLSENAGLNATDIIAKLYAAHERGEAAAGVDIEGADVGETGVLDLLITKESALRLAADVAITILRVDQIIMAKPAGGPKPPAQSGNWDDD